MPTSSAVTRRAPDLTSLAFLAVAFLTGIAGAVAEIWSYHAVFYAALAMATGATLCLWKLKEA
jgi:hypothetical protein